MISVRWCKSWIRRILVLFVVDAAGKPCCHAFGGRPSGTATDCYIDASMAIFTAKHRKKNHPIPLNSSCQELRIVTNPELNHWQ